MPPCAAIRHSQFVAQYRMDGAWGHAQIAGILRKVGYEYQPTADVAFQKGSQTGWGVNLSSTINLFAKDKLLLQVVHGDGIATYARRRRNGYRARNTRRRRS